jgi:hypothetical protein
MMKIFLGINILLIFLLFVFGFVYLSSIQGQDNEWFLSPFQVRGSAVIFNELPFTLNFDQQTSLIKILNKSKKLMHVTSPLPASKEPRKIEIYLFNQPDIVINLWNEDHSLLKVSSADPPYFLDIKKPSALKELLENSFDQ